MEEIKEEQPSDLQKQSLVSAELGAIDANLSDNESSDKISIASGQSASILNVKDDKIIPPSEDPYEKAWKYLAKHDIIHLFQGITANVFYHKPKDPLEDMIQQIEKLQEEDRIKKGIIKRTSADNDDMA